MINFKSLLLIAGGVLVMISCGSRIKKIDADSFANDEMNKTAKVPTYFFKGTGNEPFWNVEITTDSIKFNSVTDYGGFSASGVKMTALMDANIKEYKSESKSGTIKVIVQQSKCVDNMSGQENKYTVKVEIKKRLDFNTELFEGCGNYVVNYRLHDIWVPEEIEGKKVTASDFGKEIPVMEINAAEATFMIDLKYGATVKGKLFSENKLLRFVDINTTEKKPKPISVEFLTALKGVTHFEIKNNRLYLSNPDGMKAVFRKVD
ncbi:heat-shock protein [Flavobacterium sp. '19STA2R22 D10 B1']|uniref:heat-shock protein n=1 Tax=Flavobacterium aerium TaxID=3037261 RepID=UPI00278C8472|nr:heat-shock protein [Flavobacterium sp. '19STA2R22 D10 B1']